MKPRWIFFDLGWTLVDETEAHNRRFDDLLKWFHKRGIDHDKAELVGLCEEAAARFVESPFWGMLQDLGLSTAQISELRDSVRYAKEEERLYEGVPDLLAHLSQSYRLGVIANQSAGTEARLRAWRIRDLFSVVFASAERGLSKPDPEIFAQALAVAGCHPTEALMVGDRLDNDIGPANQQGWQTTRVLQGFSRVQKPRSSVEQPDATLKQITDIYGQW